MPLPASVTTVPVHIVVLAKDGTPAKGRAAFVGPYALRDTTGKEIVGPPQYSEPLDTNGEVTLDVIATNDPDLSPSGWAYTVTIATDVWRETFQVEIPYDTVGTLELADIAPAVTPPPVVTYVLASLVGAVGGVPGPLDANRQIPAAQIPAPVVDNGDGTASITSTAIVDHGDGTAAA